MSKLSGRTDQKGLRESCPQQVSLSESVAGLPIGSHTLQLELPVITEYNWLLKCMHYFLLGLESPDYTPKIDILDKNSFNNYIACYMFIVYFKVPLYTSTQYLFVETK